MIYDPNNHLVASTSCIINNELLIILIKKIKETVNDVWILLFMHKPQTVGLLPPV